MNNSLYLPRKHVYTRKNRGKNGAKAKNCELKLKRQTEEAGQQPNAARAGAPLEIRRYFPLAHVGIICLELLAHAAEEIGGGFAGVRRVSGGGGGGGGCGGG